MQGSEVAPSGETHPRQSLLGVPHSWHGDKVTNVPAVTSHSQCWLCPWEHSSLSPACPRAEGSCHRHGLPGSYSIPGSQETTGKCRQLDRAEQHLPCAVWALSAPALLTMGKPRQAVSTAEEGWLNQCCSGGVPWAHGSSIQSHPSWARIALLYPVFYIGSCCSPLGPA